MKKHLLCTTIAATSFVLLMTFGIMGGSTGALAGVITTSSVTPVGIGPGDTTVSGGVTVGNTAAGTLDLNAGNTLTVNEILTPTSTFDGARIHVGNGGTGAFIIDNGSVNINAAAGRFDGARLQISNMPGVDSPSQSGTVTMSNGASLTINAVESAGINVGRDGLGTMTANGSIIDIDSTNGSASITVGGGTSSGLPMTPQPATEGHLTLSNNTQVSISSASSSGRSAGIIIGRTPNATGPIVTNTLDILSGTDIVIDNTGSGSGGSFFNVSASGADAEVTVSGGSTVAINYTGTGSGRGALQVGRDGTGTGTMTVTGAGPNVTTADFVSVGRDGETGTLNVEDGGTITNTAGPGLSRIGRDGGTGTLNVTGTGSLFTADNMQLGRDDISTGASGTVNVNTGGAINLTDTLMVGRTDTSTGTLNIGAGGTINAHAALVGVDTGSTGTATVSGAGAQLNLSGVFPTTGTDQDGAVLLVGSRGAGLLNVNTGGVITVAPGTPFGTGLSGGMLIRGSSSNPIGTGNGTVNVDGVGSSIIFSALNGQAGNTQVGRDGTGVLNITNGGNVDGSTQNLAVVGRLAGSTGTVNVTGAGSTWAANNLFIGTNVNFGTVTASGPGGNGTVNVANGGTLSAGTIVNGATGTITGGGGLIQGNIFNSGTIGPGNSPGLMSVSGNVDLLSGGPLAIELGGLVVDTGYDRLDVNAITTISSGSVFDIDFFGGFTAGLGNTFDILVSEDIFVADLGALIFDFSGALLRTGLAWEVSLLDNTFEGGPQDALRLTVVADEVAVPEPSAILILLGGLLTIVGLRRKKAI